MAGSCGRRSGRMHPSRDRPIPLVAPHQPVPCVFGRVSVAPYRAKTANDQTARPRSVHRPAESGDQPLAQECRRSARPYLAVRGAESSWLEHSRPRDRLPSPFPSRPPSEGGQRQQWLQNRTRLRVISHEAKRRASVCVPFVGSGFAHHTRRNTTTKHTKNAGCRGGERL